ncbi:hypothetical protein BDD12DRAFT_935826 [Trichophaea hybrida]|nr:hypothetical protein BDD12DRAFT_935826 [Trichophaea hybrida]
MDSSAQSSADTLATTPPGTISSSGSDAENQSKLRTLLGILRRFVGVADIASVRFSLPSQLLEPIPNLEYWNYLDRPETFASIGDSDDEIGRFLAVLRFWFTKDLKFIKGKPCKPYNSTLGEFFRPARVSFLTEQTSHHPPVSAFYIECPEKGISANGYDQISAKFTGTSIKVTPGVHNLGIFITLHSRGDESYRLTHPIAHLGGLLRGALTVYVEDISFITCSRTKIRCILQYIGDSWLGKPKHRVEGVIYRFDHATEDIERIKDVPIKAILAKIEGSWMNQLYYTMTGSKEKRLLIDLDPLLPVLKTCPPPEEQLPNESRKKWEKVTEAIHAKDYGTATQLKQDIEERQREKAAERQEKQIHWKPQFFEDMAERVGQPHLSEEGKKVLQGLNVGNYKLEPYEL